MPKLLLSQIRAVLNDAGLTPGDHLGVALSGGYDSLVLTHALASLARSGEGPAVAAIHVNHRMRPEADRDAEDVVARAACIGVPLDVAVVDVNPWSDWLDQGVEAGARAARYAAIATFARERGLDWIATGHTLNDQAETVLMRLASGSSLDGLAGLRVVTRREVPLTPGGSDSMRLAILRPLLAVQRRDIERYAQVHGLTSVVDLSNNSLDFRRNQIRHLVLPSLNQVYPGSVESIGRTVAGLADDADYLRGIAEDLLKNASVTSPGLLLIQRQAIREQHLVLQRRVLAAAFYQIAGSNARLTRERLESLRELALAGRNSARAQLGTGIVARVDYDWLVFGDAVDIESRLRARSGYPLLHQAIDMAPGTMSTVPAGNEWQLRLSRRNLNIGPVSIRTRRSGDRLQLPDGRLVRLQDWLVNRKVPVYVRDVLPLLDVNGVIVWVASTTPSQYMDASAGIELELALISRGG